MFSLGVKLSLKLRPNDRMELSLSLWSRLILALFFLLSCAVLSSDLSSREPPDAAGRGHLLPLLLVCVTGLSALYEEKWIFDKRRGLFENRFGLVILSLKKKRPLDELAYVHLESFSRGPAPENARPSSTSEERSPWGILRASQGGRSQRMVRLTVVDNQEMIHILDSARAHRIEELRRTGARIAEFCGIPFSEG